MSRALVFLTDFQLKLALRSTDSLAGKHQLGYLHEFEPGLSARLHQKVVGLFLAHVLFGYYRPLRFFDYSSFVELLLEGCDLGVELELLAVDVGTYVSPGRKVLFAAAHFDTSRWYRGTRDKKDGSGASLLSPCSLCQWQ